MKTYISKTTRFACLAGSASLMLAAGAAYAGDPAGTGIYLNTDAGVNLTTDLTVPGRGSISTDPGLRWDISMGYACKLTDAFTLSGELETGILYNSLDKATSGGGSASVNGELYQVPVMANLIFDWHVNSDWSVYAGAGAGLDYSTIHTSVGSDVLGSESDFGWQAVAGVRYKLGESSEVGLGDKYLAVKPSGMETIGNNSIFASYTLHF